MLKKTIVLLVVIVMLLSFPVSAVDTYGGYDIPIDIDINGSFIQCVQKPIIQDGITYLPLRAFSDAIGGAITWNGEEGAATMVQDGHSFTFYPGKSYCYIDGVQYNHAAIIYKDLTFIPVRVVSEMLHYDVEWDEFYLTVKITAPGVSVLESSKDATYTYEDVLYLGKIIQIESGYQHFDVMLGVGGTILNRMHSSEFPNTVKDVIFDTKYSVQFPPAHTEKFDKTPSKASIIAAKSVLNGVNIVGNSLYFIDTQHASSSWAHNNRPFYATISDMNFYE